MAFFDKKFGNLRHYNFDNFRSLKVKHSADKTVGDFVKSENLATFTVKMSGEVSRSRQKKAAASTAKKGQNGQNGQNGSQAPAGSSKSSAFMKEQKKKSKDRNNQNKNKMPAKAKSPANGGFLSSTTILIVLVALTGVSVASYHQYPEKVQAVYEFLPPQVRFLDSFFPYECFFSSCDFFSFLSCKIILV